MNHLVKLHIPDHYFRDGDLEALLSNKPHLRSLDLSAGFGDQCANQRFLSDAGIRTITRICPKLDALYLDQQRAVTMAGLEHILTSCSQMRDLRVGMERLDASLVRMLPQAKQLRILAIDTAYGATPKFVYDAILATEGEVLISTFFHGLVELPATVPSSISQTYRQNKSVLEGLDYDDPSVINEWEAVPLRSSSADANPVAVTSSNSNRNNPTSDSGTTASAPRASSPKCSWHACRNPNAKTGACGRCKSEFYCSSACQKIHWQVHKYKCVPVATPRHQVSEFTVEAIQASIDNARDGDVILLKEGHYKSPSSSPPKLVVNKPLSILGPLHGMDKIKLECSLVVRASGRASDSQHKLVLADFEFGKVSQVESGTDSMGAIENNSYKEVNLYNIRVSCDRSFRGDAFMAGSSGGKTVFDDCEILGGSDGLHIAGPNVYLKRTEIRFAANRGIFSRQYFTLEDCVVDMCGAYGIKGSAGWHEKGDNDIQPGPWASSGMGMGFSF